MKNENIIFNSKIIRIILIHLNRKEFDYGSNIAKDERLTHSNIMMKLKLLKELGLVESVETKGKKRYPFIEKSNRSKYYKLTDKGKRIVELILKINNEFETN